MPRTFNDMFRPAFETPACAGWAVSAVGLAATTPPFWPLFAIGSLAMAYLRGREAVDLYRFRASISSERVEKIKATAAVKLAEKHYKVADPDHRALWIGRGFRWTQSHAELARTIMFRDPGELPAVPAWMPKPVRDLVIPKNLAPLKEDAVGVAWIHGLQPEESELRLPIPSLSGHTLVTGTTRAGKTRLYELITTQIVHMGSVLIIIDPKGDKDWENRVRLECKKAGRKFLFFHPARPSESIRINPLANWNTLSEPATRIGQLIDAEGTFAAFAWKTLFRVMRGITADGERPTIKASKEYIQGGIEGLLERLLSKKLYALQGAKWENDLDAYKPEKPPGKKGAANASPGLDRLEMIIGKYLSLNIKDETVDSLISMQHHSKEHYSKMIQTLEPILEMLGSDELGKMLSPDPLDLSDNRPIYDTTKIIEENAVLYVGLDSLSNKTIGSAIGSILLADIASVAGDIYNFKDKKDIYLFVDEAAEVMNEQAIQILNKGGGAGIKAFIATQTTADFDAVFGATARTKQALGNLNNVICLRVKDPDMAKWIADSFGQTSARVHNTSHSSGSGSASNFLEFNGSSSRSTSETEIPFVSPDLLTRLPGLQFFAFLAGSALYKGRLPLLQD